MTESVSVRRIRRFAIPLCFEGQDAPSLARPLDGTNVHRTFLYFRLALEHIGEPTDPPRIAPARGPPAWEAEAEALQLVDPIAHPEPDFSFDQTVDW